MQVRLLAIPLISAARAAKPALIFAFPARPDTSLTHQHVFNVLRDSTQQETTHLIAPTVQLDARYARIILPTIKSPAVVALPAMDIPIVPATNVQLARLQQAANQSVVLLDAAPVKEYNALAASPTTLSSTAHVFSA